jgi:hypothetical protein
MGHAFQALHDEALRERATSGASSQISPATATAVFSTEPRRIARGSERLPFQKAGMGFRMGSECPTLHWTGGR